MQRASATKTPILLHKDSETSIYQDLVCSVCLEIPIWNPVVSPCDHVFCRECYDEMVNCLNATTVPGAVRPAHICCPLDRKEIRSVTPMKGVLRRVWESIQVKCPYEGCAWRGTMGMYLDHASERCQAASAERKKNANANEEDDKEALAAQVMYLLTELKHMSEMCEIMAVSGEEQDRKICSLERENRKLKQQLSQLRPKKQQGGRGGEAGSRQQRRGGQQQAPPSSSPRASMPQPTVQETQASQEPTVDPYFDGNYAWTMNDLSEIVALVERNPTRKPSNVDRNKVFEAIRNLQGRWIRSGGLDPDLWIDQLEDVIDVCMSSSWFSANQNSRFEEMQDTLFDEYPI